MKTTIITTAILVFALVSSNAKTKNEMNSVTEFGSYHVAKVEASQAVVSGSKGEYIIHYTQFDNPVKVSVVQKDNCKVFLVRTNGYEVQYTCNGNSFGASYMDAEYATYPMKDMAKKINRVEYLHQRVITKKQRSEKEMVRLIACFLPELLS